MLGLSNIPILLTDYKFNLDLPSIQSDATTGTWSRLYTLGSTVAVGMFTILQKIAVLGLIISVVLLGITLFTTDSGSGKEKMKSNLVRVLIVSAGLSAVITLVTAAVQIGASF